MRAIEIEEYGSNDVIKIIEADRPELRDDEVLVKVQTAGINPIDWRIRGGAGKRMGLELPIRLGSEIAGIIEKVGSSVTDLKVGDAVYGMVKSGGFADYLATKATNLSLKPANVDYKDAVAIPLGGTTAWQAFALANLQAGQRILITGASGGVGSLAVQFAKEKGAYVIGTGSGKNETYVRDLGASEYIDYETKKFEELVKDVDVVFDTVGGDTFEKSIRTLKKGGFLVTAVTFFPEDTAAKNGIKVQRIFSKPSGEDLKQISALVAKGKVKARVSSVLPFEEVKEALRLSESGKANGKIVLQIGTLN